MICKRGTSELPPHALVPANDFEREIWDDIYLSVPKYESFQQSRAVPPQQRDSRAGLIPPLPRPATYHNLTRVFARLIDFLALAFAMVMIFALFGLLP